MTIEAQVQLLLERLRKVNFRNSLCPPSEEDIVLVEQAIAEGATVSWVYGPNPKPFILRKATR